MYPQKLFLKADDDYVWPDLDWDIAPCNTAFVCFHDPAFLAQYTQTAIDFMEHCSQADDPANLHGICGTANDFHVRQADRTPIHELDNLAHLFGNRQTDFTHTWGFKQQMRDNPPPPEQFCKRCAVRLVLDFPESLETLQKIPELAKYL